MPNVLCYANIDLCMLRTMSCLQLRGAADVQREAEAVEQRVLLGGCLLTASSFAAAWAARAMYEKRMKQL